MARELWDSAAKFTTGVDACGPGWWPARSEVADVALDEGDPVLDVGQVGPVPGVGEGVVGDDRSSGCRSTQ